MIERLNVSLKRSELPKTVLQTLMLIGSSIKIKNGKSDSGQETTLSPKNRVLDQHEREVVSKDSHYPAKISTGTAKGHKEGH